MIAAAMTELFCPQCQEALQETLNEETATEVKPYPACPNHHGIWVTRDEFKALSFAPATEDALAMEPNPNNFDALKQEPKWGCPLEGTAMWQLSWCWSDGITNTMDMCPLCGGVWLNTPNLAESQRLIQVVQQKTAQVSSELQQLLIKSYMEADSKIEALADQMSKSILPINILGLQTLLKRLSQFLIR